MKESQKYRKFQSSVSTGGEYFRGRPLLPTKDVVKRAEHRIVEQLRARAEEYERAGYDALPGKSNAYAVVAQELRDCAASIRLNDWTGMKEP